MELVAVEFDAGAEVGGGASSSSMSRVASTTCARPRAPLASKEGKDEHGQGEHALCRN
jgi:hypothetical protein